MNILKRTMLALVVFLVGVTPFVTVLGVSATSEDDKYTEVVFHAGDEGYFGTPDVKEIAVRQRRGDIVRNVPEVTTVDPEMVLDGWKLKAEDTYTIDEGSANVSMVNGNLYATYTRGYEVSYIAGNGRVIVDGTPTAGNSYAKSYTPGTYFDTLDGAVNNDDEIYEFNGWYINADDSKIFYDEDTVIDEKGITVFADWKIKDDGAEELEQGVAHEAELADHSRVFKFTPADDGWYNVYTSGKDPAEERSITLFMMNADAETLKNGVLVSGLAPMGDVHISYYMEGGTTYYFSLQEYSGREVENITLTAAPVETANVTFHIKESERGQAWFDDDVNKMEKTMEVPVSDNTYYYNDIDMGVSTSEDGQKLSFYKWETEDGEIDIYIIEDIDLYAVYDKSDVIVLSANGGRFTNMNDAEITSVPAREDRAFSSSLVPVFGDGTDVIFAGWSRNPDAELPDEDIIEEVTPASELARETLYAIYTEPVLVSYNVPDELYFFVNPDMKQYEILRGKGASFANMAVNTDVPGLINAGWVDQDGNFIPIGTGQGWYRFYKDTVFEAAAGAYVYVDANPDEGGYLVDPDSGSWAYWMNVPLANSKPFSYKMIEALVGKPQNEDSLKYFIGWASTPNATEPDIIDGVTPSYGFAEESIYAVWGEDRYYFEEGDGATWQRGSSEGHRVVVKREHDDEETFNNFTGIAIDGQDMTRREGEVYDVEKGSLILTLKPEYLESLEDDEHTLTIFFSGHNMETSFVIVEPSEDSDDLVPVPDTGSYTMIDAGRVTVASGVGLVVTLTFLGGYFVIRRHFSKKI